MTILGTRVHRAAGALSVLLGCVLLIGQWGTARAEDKKTIVILDIQGGTKALNTAILNALKDKYTIIPVAKWNLFAKRLNVSGQQTEEVAMIASELKADAVVTGKVKQDKDSGQWKANIAARNGRTGNPIGKLSYDLKSQKVDADIVAQVEKDIGPAVEKAIVGEPPEPAPANMPEPSPAGLLPTAELGKEEDPIARMKKLEEEQRRLSGFQPRPVFYPYIDASAGFILSGRSFSFTEEAAPSNVGCYDFDRRRPDPNDPSRTPASVFTYGNKLSKCANYATSMAGGVHVDLTAYPLAALRPIAIRGLGIGASFDYIFWPDSSTAGANPVNLATSESRLEAGIRYHYNILNKRSRPSILASAQYGFHSFSIAKQERVISYMDEMYLPQTTTGYDDHGLSNIFYQYVTIGLGGRVPYFANEKLYFGLLLNFNFHAVLSYGEIASALDKNASPASAKNPDGTACADPQALYCTGGYGPVNSGYGLRASMTILEAMLWRGLTIRLSGYYELFKYGFQFGSGTNNNVSLPPSDRKLDYGARHIAPGATDNYFGGIISVGYQY